MGSDAVSLDMQSRPITQHHIPEDLNPHNFNVTKPTLYPHNVHECFIFYWWWLIHYEFQPLKRNCTPALKYTWHWPHSHPYIRARHFASICLKTGNSTATYFQPVRWQSHQTDWFQAISCMWRETTLPANKPFHSYEKGKMHTQSFKPFTTAPAPIKQKAGWAPQLRLDILGDREVPCTCPTHSLVTIATTEWK